KELRTYILLPSCMLCVVICFEHAYEVRSSSSYLSGRPSSSSNADARYSVVYTCRSLLLVAHCLADSELPALPRAKPWLMTLPMVDRVYSSVVFPPLSGLQAENVVGHVKNKGHAANPVVQSI